MATEWIVPEIVKIPKGSYNQYEIDRETGNFSLNRVLHSTVHSPVEYGFVPDTMEQDGNPLDIMCLVTHPTFPGCIIECRVVGLLRMTDEHGQNGKLLAVPVRDAHFSHVHALKDLPRHQLDEIVHFIEMSRNIEDRSAVIHGWEEADYAKKILRKSETRRKMADLR